MDIRSRSSSLNNTRPIAVILLILSCFDNNSTGFQTFPVLPEAPPVNDWVLPGSIEYQSIDIETRSEKLFEPMNQLRFQSQGLDEPLEYVVDGVRVPAAYFPHDSLQSERLLRQHNGRRMKLTGSKWSTGETRRRRGVSRREKQAKRKQSLRQGITPRPVARNIRPSILLVQRLIPLTTTTPVSPPAPVVIPPAVITVVGCQRSSLRLSCPASTTMRIVAANYGRQSTTICPGRGSTTTTMCSAPLSLANVQDKCEGRRECNLTARNADFSNPCRRIFKYLEVTFFCA